MEVPPENGTAAADLSAVAATATTPTLAMMAIASAPARTAAELLSASPGLFDWRQAVRIAVDAARRLGRRTPGFDWPPGEESPRLTASPEMSHSYADVSTYHAGPDGKPELVLSLTDAASRLTLLGSHGALPAWYSELALDREERGDRTFTEFIGIFEHRLLSLAYRGWWHQRLELRREQTAAGEDLPDIDVWLDAVAGLSPAAGAGRLRQTSRWPIRRFAPIFANMARTAWGLAALLGACAGTPVRVEELVPRWLDLTGTDRNRLPDGDRPDGVNCRLGGGLVLGEKVREAQSNFNIVLGPMRWDVFLEFLPDAAGGRLPGLCELAALYAGPDRSFGVRMELAAGEARGICLGSAEARLGWSVWLLSEAGNAAADDVFWAAPGQSAIQAPVRL